jgi:polysaccharide export outer membrane protein
VVTVEFLNASVYVLGDVSSPGEVPINKEGLNIMQALSLAGDLSITGQRENVLVVREEEGGNHAYRIDLTDKEGLVQSPVFYLQQNDVVYVEPNDMQKRNSKSNANTIITPTFWMSVVSFLTALGVLIF